MPARLAPAWTNGTSAKSAFSVQVTCSPVRLIRFLVFAAIMPAFYVEITVLARWQFVADSASLQLESGLYSLMDFPSASVFLAKSFL